MKKIDYSQFNQRDDVFQISLTELAFTIIFLILVLVGLTIKKSDEDMDVLNTNFKQATIDRDNATNKYEYILNEKNGIGDVLIKKDMVENILENIKDVVIEPNNISSKSSTESLLKKLTENEEAKKIAEEYKKILEELDKELSNLKEIKMIANQNEVNKEKPSIEKETDLISTIKSSIIFRKEIENKIGKKFDDTNIQNSANIIASKLNELNKLEVNKDSTVSLSKENTDLKGQVVWLKNKLNANGGRDYPPCWAEEVSGKPQYLFIINILSNGFQIDSAWPKSREHDASLLPGISSVLDHSIYSIDSFRERVSAINKNSIEKNCRHYVKLINRVNDLQSFNKHRFAVEEFFYKYEIR